MLENRDEARQETSLVFGSGGVCRKEVSVGVRGGGFGLQEEDRDIGVAS